MKRIGGLFDAIADVRTLTYASWRAARGKWERTEVRSFLSRLDEETGRLTKALHDGSFRFGEYRAFPIRDPKTRTIHAPPFPDRVVHHAILAVAGAVFERGAIPNSYACRLGRGQHASLRQALKWMRLGDWFWKADVAKFYDNVDHDILRALLFRRFRERRLLALFDRLLDSYAHSPGKGLPIGALTSQYMGNFYLDSFDHWVKGSAHMRRYMRYMDDMLFFDHRETLDGVRHEAPAILDGFGLAIAHDGIMNRCELGVPWLGFVVYPDRIRLNRQGRRRLRHKMKDMEVAWENGCISEAELQTRGEALFAHARFGDDVAWRRMTTRFSRIWEAQEPEPRLAGRVVEQFREQVPLGVSQQEQAG